MKVSELFVDIYKNFNVSEQYHKMMKLPRKELLLLLVLASDSFDENSFAIENFLNFRDELILIQKIHEDNYQPVDDDIILLIGETNDKLIDTSCIFDQNNKKLPKPLTEEAARIKRREIGINNILNK